MSAAKAWRDNTGTAPRGANRKGARVHVRLRNGLEPHGTWDAQTMRWSLMEHPFDVVQYRFEVEP